MKRLLFLFLLAPALAFGQANVIRNLQLQGNANGATNSWTNLTDVVLSSGVRLSTVASGGITNLVTSGTVTGSLNLSAGTLSLTGTETSGSGTLTNATGSGLLFLGVNGATVTGGLSSAVATGNQWNASVAAVGLVASGSMQRTGGTITGELYVVNGTGGDASIVDGSITAVSIVTPSSEATMTVQGFTGNGSGITNLPIYIASGGTVAQTSTGTVLTITGGGGSASLSPWTNTVNAAGYSLTNAASVQWAAVTNYQWIRWVGTNPVEAILVNASGGVTGKVERYSGADFIFSYP